MELLVANLVSPYFIKNVVRKYEKNELNLGVK